ncbi:MAG: hypothetical protein LKI25_06250 [Atopobiaceae bacterium]|jgi:PHD/YefM family antitoxin component YafN of YafNO toxin-antitoxin module|nr:hypothetical protein [Atopobiaceae bacterium]MCI2173799.1 hypothetical protein [Atopobiaceae bacterium]MCI2207559.1 hypothetical protein [Atopobiaceae bacterium]
MAAIYPISALQKDATTVRERARHEVVHLTENGHGAYVFATEETFDEYVARKQEEAVEEARLAATIERGDADCSAGRTYDLEEGIALIRQVRDQRAAG